MEAAQEAGPSAPGPDALATPRSSQPTAFRGSPWWSPPAPPTRTCCAASPWIPRAYPDLSVLTAEYQSAARGRLDRHWEAPARSSVSVSMVLRPVNAEGRPLPTQSYSWLSLLAALALREALLETAGIPAELKWPNDVLVRGRKIAGILAQLGPMGDGAVPPVVLGTGLNVTLTEAELPVPTATSVLLEHPTTVDRTALLKSYLSRFATLYRSFCNADGDPAAGMAGGPSLHKRVEHVLTTLGKQVRAQLPG